MVVLSTLFIIAGKQIVVNNDAWLQKEPGVLLCGLFIVYAVCKHDKGKFTNLFALKEINLHTPKMC